MISVSVLNMQGEQVGEMDLKEEIFATEPHEVAVHRAVVRVLAGQRRGTASTKSRGEVAGSTRKPWRQKGTGRARAGSLRSPVWRGGGIVFGPKPRDYSFSLPKKERRLALRAVLSAKLSDGKLIIVDSVEVPTAKTKEILAALRAVKAVPQALIVIAEANGNVVRAVRNIPGIDVTTVAGLNPYQVLAHDKIVLSRSAVARLEEVLG